MIQCFCYYFIRKDDNEWRTVDAEVSTYHTMYAKYKQGTGEKNVGNVERTNAHVTTESCLNCPNIIDQKYMLSLANVHPIRCQWNIKSLDKRLNDATPAASY
jgi:hypothetical protein